MVLAVISIGTGIAALFHAEVERFAWLVWGLLALGAGAVFLAKRKKYRVFQGGETPLVMFDGLPNKMAFDTFLSELHRLRLQWLTNRIVAELGGQPVRLRKYLSAAFSSTLMDSPDVRSMRLFPPAL